MNNDAIYDLTFTSPPRINASGVFLPTNAFDARNQTIAITVGRSFGNQMVLTMLSGLLGLGFIFLILMYFLVIKEPGMKGMKEENQEEMACGHTNNGFQ